MLVLFALASVSLGADACDASIPTDLWFSERLEAVSQVREALLSLADAETEDPNIVFPLLSEAELLSARLDHLRDLAEFSRLKPVRVRALELFKLLLKGDPFKFNVKAVNIYRSRAKTPALVSEAGRLRTVLEESRQNLRKCIE